jgi:SAM-dependent methyltransferase
MRETTAHDAEPDPYLTGVCRWWHLSTPSPELLEAIETGFLPRSGAVLDVGSGYGTETGYLARRGYRSVGVDRSRVATLEARARHPEARFLRGDAVRLPFRDRSFDAAVDRGCFHYLPPERRPEYVAEVARVVKPAGPFLLRACLRSAGVRNDLNPEVLRTVFTGWRVESLRETTIPSDTRRMDALVVRLRREDPARGTTSGRAEIPQPSAASGGPVLSP